MSEDELKKHTDLLNKLTRQVLILIARMDALENNLAKHQLSESSHKI